MGACADFESCGPILPSLAQTGVPAPKSDPAPRWFRAPPRQVRAINTESGPDQSLAAPLSGGVPNARRSELPCFLRAPCRTLQTHPTIPVHRAPDSPVVAYLPGNDGCVETSERLRGGLCAGESSHWHAIRPSRTGEDPSSRTQLPLRPDLCHGSGMSEQQRRKTSGVLGPSLLIRPGLRSPSRPRALAAAVRVRTLRRLATRPECARAEVRLYNLNSAPPGQEPKPLVHPPRARAAQACAHHLIVELASKHFSLPTGGEGALLWPHMRVAGSVHAPSNSHRPNACRPCAPRRRRMQKRTTKNNKRNNYNGGTQKLGGAPAQTRRCRSGACHWGAAAQRRPHGAAAARAWRPSGAHRASGAGAAP